MRVPEITADQLAQRLEGGEPLQVLDIRMPSRAAEGHIETTSYRNVPVTRLFALLHADETGLDRGMPVAVVCDRGVSSRTAVLHLRQQGFEAVSIAGGMLAWSVASVPRRLEDVGPLDLVVQFDRLAKGALAYLLVRRRKALLVDPGRDLSPYVAEIESLGAQLVAVAETHAHADYLSGAAAAADRWQVPHYLHPADSISPYDGRSARLHATPLEPERPIELGDIPIGIESTPGHTEGSVTLRVGDAIALTGDFLFVESIGRPDLGDKTEEWTGVLWNSLERARSEWPAELRVLPAHYGAESERNADRTVGAPFGSLPARNHPLTLRDEAAFHAWVAARSGSYPDAYRSIKLANLGLLALDQEESAILEAGKNQCALAG